jgi:hypothetical protein
MAINCLGNKSYITTPGLHGLHHIKNLTPSWASPVRKRVRALGMNAKTSLVTEARLYVTRLVPYKTLLKCKTDKDCLRSMNAPALDLGDP